MRDLGFAFNDQDFSDRILRIEVVEDSLDSNSNSKGSDLDCVAEPWIKKLSRKQKRRLKEKGGDPVYYYNSECSSDVKVKSLHICSAILAGSSPFFYKLFKNGMRESWERVVVLQINTSEEALALMDVLEFMYSNTLSATSAFELVNVLLVADKFEVSSCMRHCCELLKKMPMSLESALFYLELPSSVLKGEEVKPLIDVAKQHVVSHYRDFTKSHEEAIDLPLSAVEVVLESEGLQVFSEDDVLDFIVEWARVHYPILEERRKILTKRLTRFIYFPNMSSFKLKEVLVCPEFDHEQVSKLVMEAIFSKVENSCGQHIHASKELATTDCGFSGRVYRPRSVVYFVLTKDELKSLSPGEYLDSQPFCLGGKQLFLSAEREQEHGLFGLFVCKAKDTETCNLDFELAVMKKSSMEFESKLKVNNHTLGDKGWGSRNLLRISWTDFMSDDCDYFIDDILHLRAEITLVSNSQP